MSAPYGFEYIIGDSFKKSVYSFCLCPHAGTISASISMTARTARKLHGLDIFSPSVMIEDPWKKLL